MKEMRPVQVSYSGGCVCLVQPDPHSNPDDTIILTPEQAPLVIEWIQEAVRDASREGT